MTEPGTEAPDPQQPDPNQMSEDELRRRMAEEMKRIQVGDVVVQTVVTLINLGGQRLGLTEDSKDVRDLDQAHMAIEGVRALLPLLEQQSPGDLSPIRDALAQLQVAYAREAGAGDAGGQAAPSGNAEPAKPASESQQAPAGQGDSGLWVPPGSKG